MINRIPPVVKNLLIINILMLVLGFVADSMFQVDINRYLGIYFWGSEMFKPYQFITYMFMHGGISHLIFNMFALWMFGRVLESVWGGKRFFIYYLVTGVGAAVIQSLVYWYQISEINEAAIAFTNTPSPDLFISFVREYFPQYYNQVYDKLLYEWTSDPDNQFLINRAMNYTSDLINMKMNVPTVGASGAVFGILLAFGMLFPNTELMLLIPPIPIKAKYFVIIYGVIELFAGVSNQAGDNVAHFAHLGGMVFGFLLLKYWGVNNNKKYF